MAVAVAGAAAGVAPKREVGAADVAGVKKEDGAEPPPNRLVEVPGPEPNKEPVADVVAVGPAAGLPNILDIPAPVPKPVLVPVPVPKACGCCVAPNGLANEVLGAG